LPLLLLVGVLSGPSSVAREADIGGTASLSYLEGLQKADVVVVAEIDAGQVFPPMFHAKVIDAVKGLAKGAEFCASIARPAAPVVGGAQLMFLWKSESSGPKSRLTGCSAGPTFKIVDGAPDPVSVVYTTDVPNRCPAPPCGRGAEVVKLDRTALPGITTSFPVVNMTQPAETWLYKDDVLSAMRSYLATH
jgi:hypothetical protein